MLLQISKIVSLQIYCARIIKLTQLLTKVAELNYTLLSNVCEIFKLNYHNK